MFINLSHNTKCRIYLLKSPSLQGDVLLISSEAQATALIRTDIQTENVLSLLFALSMTERISERLHCQMGDCSFMGIVCETPRNMSALSVVKHTKHFCMWYCGTEAIASPICAVANCISVLQHPLHKAEITPLIWGEDCHCQICDT